VTLFLLSLVIVSVLSATTSCNTGGAQRLEVTDSLSTSNCEDLKVCAVPCSRIVRGCRYHTSIFDIGKLAEKVTEGFTDENDNESSWEKISYQQVCVDKIFTKTGDLFASILRKLPRFEKKIEKAKPIVACTREFIKWFRTLENKCKQQKNWIETLKREIMKFDVEKNCPGMSKPQRDAFEWIQKPIRQTHIRLARADDDVSESKFCQCLDFEKFFGREKSSKVHSPSKRIQLDKFHVDYLSLHKLMRRTCEKKCGIKNGIRGWLKNAGRIIGKSIKEGTFGIMKRFKHRQIIARLEIEIRKITRLDRIEKRNKDDEDDEEEEEEPEPHKPDTRNIRKVEGMIDKLESDVNKLE